MDRGTQAVYSKFYKLDQIGNNANNGISGFIT